MSADAVDHRTQIRRGLISTLAEASFFHSGGWSTFLDELSLSIGPDLPTHTQKSFRLQVTDVVNACVERPDGPRSIAEAVEFLFPGHNQTLSVLRWVDEWHVVELFGDVGVGWLKRELGGLRATKEEYGLAMQIRQAEPPAHCGSVWELFASLAGENAVDGAPPCIRFLDRLTASLRPEVHDDVRRLITTLSLDWAADGEPDTDVNGAASAPGPADTAYLIIQLERYGGANDTFLVSHWRQWSTEWAPVRGDDRRVAGPELETAVEEIVIDVERGWAGRSGTVMIEFVLPDSLLDLPVDEYRWQRRSAEAVPLAVRYPMYVRSLDRLRSIEWHRVWRTRWERAANHTMTEAVVHCAEDGGGALQIEANLKEGALVLVLSEPPVPGSAGERQILAGLRAGLPAVVWHRTSPADRLRPAIMSMVGDALGRSRLTDLPILAAELRKQGWAAGADGREHLGIGLVILWDDPDRIPDRPAGTSGRIDT
jgi:hypothetical protein